MFDSLRIPAYRRYMIGFTGSGVAFTNQQVAMGWLAYDLTQSPSALGAVLLFSGITMAIGSLAGGVIADRWDRRATIISLQAFAALNSLVIGLLVVTDHIQFWYLYPYAALNGLATGIHLPSRQAFVYNIVGKELLPNAMAINVANNNIMRLAAPALAGYFIAWFGVGSVFFSIVAGFGLSAVVMLFFVGPTKQEYLATREHPVRAMLGGFTYLWRQRTLFWLVILTLVGTTMGMPFRDLMPAFAVEALDLDPQGFGLLMSMVGLGSIVGGIGIALLASSRRQGMLLVLAGMGWGVGLALLGLAPSLATAIIVIILLGCVSTFFNVINNVMLQTKADDAHRGRIASFHLLTFSTHPMGALALGALADGTTIRTAYVAFGIAMVVVMLALGIWRSDVRRLAS